MIKPVLILALIFAVAVDAQKPAPMKWGVCVEQLAPHGKHTRFAASEHTRILTSRLRQIEIYEQWEQSARWLDWFSGTKRVSLAYVKSHMPRAMLLELRFPVDQNPPVDPKGLEQLLATEHDYDVAANRDQEYIKQLLVKYGIGPAAIFDEDMGGATPQGACGKYEEQLIPDAPPKKPKEGKP